MSCNKHSYACKPRQAPRQAHAAISRLSNRPSPYEILGVTIDIDDQALRQHWKHLARTHHPDTLTADGMPEEFIAAANDRLAKINAAYDTIARQRGL